MPTRAVLAAAEALPFGVAITDGRGIVTWANPRFAQLSGRSLEELRGQPAGDFPFAELARAAPSSPPWMGEAVCRRQTGEILTLRHTVTPLRDAAGELTGFWVTKEDISAPARGLDSVSQAAANLSALIESTEDLIWSVDLDYRLLTFNRVLQQAFERSYGVLVAAGKRGEDLLPPERAALFPPLYERALTQGPFRTEYTLLDGRILEMSFHPIRHDDRTTGVSVFGKDITDRKAAEARLKAQSERFQKVIENSDAAYFRIGMDGCYEDVNAAWLRMHGFIRKQDAIGVHFSAVQNPDDLPQAEEVVNHLMRGEPARSGEFSRLRRDGTIGYHSFSANPVLDGDQVIGIEGFLVDISDRKMAEQEKRRTEEQYKWLFNSLNEGAALHRLIRSNGAPENYMLLEVNRRYEEIVGLQRGQVVNRLATDVYGTPEAPYLKEYASVVETATPLLLETYFPPMDKQFVISVAPMGGDLFATIFFDVTEQRKVEELYKLISENAADVIWLWDLAADRCVYMSPSVHHLSGFSPEETLALPVEQMMSPDSYRMIAAEMSRRIAELESGNESARIGTNEIAYLCKDGTAVATETVTKLLSDENGAVRHVLGISRDITERKRMEDDLRKSEEKFLKAFRSSPAVTLLTDLDNGYRLTDVNGSFERVTGYRREEAIGRTTAELRLWADPAEFDEAMDTLRTKGRIHDHEYHFRTRNGDLLTGLISAEVIELAGHNCALTTVIDITERKAAEQALKRSENKFASVFRSSPVAKSINDLENDGRFVEVNEAFERITGYRRDEVIGRTVTELGMWSDPNVRQEVYGRLRTDGYVRNFEHWFRKKNGDLGAGLLFIEPLDISGRAHIIVANVEITDRKRAVEALRESEERFRSLFENATVGIYRTTPGGLIELANPTLVKMLGYESVSELAERNLEGAGFEPEYPRSVFRSALEVRGMIRGVESVWTRADGSQLCVRESARCVKDAAGSTQFHEGIVEDVTDRKRAEAALKEASQFAHEVISSVREGIVVYGPDLRYQEWNRFMEEWTGVPAQDVLGRHPAEVFPFLADAGLIERIEKALAGEAGDLVEFQFTVPATGLQGWAADMSGPLRNSKGEIIGVIGTVRDITAIKRAEEERGKLEVQFYQAQKLESIGRLAGGVAHDFNNLLTVINGYSDLLLQRLQDSEPLRSYADAIRKAGERAASLTKQLLAFSRKQVIEPRVLDLNATLRESVPLLQRLIGEDVALETHLDASLGQILADPDQIHQVIMNLAVNARDAMPQGGKLDIETNNADLVAGDGACQHPEALPGRYVLMTVTDTGQGMDEAVRKHIFEPFFTTKETGKGTGLGLSTAYGIVRQSGGWIDVWSAAGVGTTFKVFLPRIDASPLSAGSGSRARRQGGGETILVVEDQKAVRLLTNAALQQCGYHVLQASDAEGAMLIAQQYVGTIHLLLTDVVLPGLNGKELAERLLALRPQLKVLFTSGYTSDVITRQGVLDRGVAFLAKPFSPDGLAAKVREVLGPAH
jgi:PAS domain S-box-containing protein